MNPSFTIKVFCRNCGYVYIENVEAGVRACNTPEGVCLQWSGEAKWLNCPNCELKEDLEIIERRPLEKVKA